MTIDAWLQAATTDADQRGLADLKPLLQTLARSTAALRQADEGLRAPGSLPPAPRHLST